MDGKKEHLIFQCVLHKKHEKSVTWGNPAEFFSYSFIAQFHFRNLCVTFKFNFFHLVVFDCQNVFIPNACSLNFFASLFHILTSDQGAQHPVAY